MRKLCEMQRRRCSAAKPPPDRRLRPPQVFKIALDYWNYFVPDVYASVSTGLADANAAFAFGGPASPASGRRQLYGGVLSKLRLLMISRMAKPEEVRRRAQHPLKGQCLYPWLPCLVVPGERAALGSCVHGARCAGAVQAKEQPLRTLEALSVGAPPCPLSCKAGQT